MYVGAMAISDAVIYDTIRALQAEHGEDARISQSMIEAASGISIRTINRAVHRLIVTGKLEGYFDVGKGYRFRLDSRGSARTD
jgi:hypothetical protein